VRRKTQLLLSTFSLFISFSAAALAQTPAENQKRIQAALEAGNLNAAIAELQALKTSNARQFAANNYDYLLGRLTERNGDAAGSTATYQSVVARNSVLSQYALWRLALLARSTGDLVLERERLRQLITLAPESLLREAASLRIGQSFYESRDFVAAISALQPLTAFKGKATARLALSLMAEAYLESGNQPEARVAFANLIAQMPDASRPDDFALAAARSLDALDTTGGKYLPLSESEHLLRASIYQFNRDFERARTHYIAVVESNSQSGAVPNALYQVGRGYYLQQRYDDALQYLGRVERFPDSLITRDALALVAATHSRLGRVDEAVAAYKLFIQRFPDAPNSERPYVNVIDLFHEAGRYKEALNWVEQARTKFKNEPGVALAQFAQLRIHLAQNKWQEVISNADRLEQISTLISESLLGSTTLSEVHFLRASALEQLGKFNEAITAYLTIPDGRDEYYGQRATQRLKALIEDSRTRALVQFRLDSLRAESTRSLAAGAADQARRSAQSALRMASVPSTRNELLEIIRKTYEELPAYKLPRFNTVALGRQIVVEKPPSQQAEASHTALAQELLFLGLYDEGVPEFVADAVITPKKAPPTASAISDTDFTLALYSLRGGLANRAIRFAEQVWKTVPSDYLLELAPHELVELLYPIPFRESLLKHAVAREVDPRFVLSIARQESRFRTDVKSAAAARGLMQFIPATATDVAKQLNYSDFRQDELYNADISILFGVQYLAALARQFPEMPEAVAASYNGGADNMARWMARSRSHDPVRYVPEIGFSQTKDYVFKVMTNFWIYQQLYDKQLTRH
jgi:peptidoglycan lytic transglycosylase